MIGVGVMVLQRRLIYFPTKMNSVLAEGLAAKEGFRPWLNSSGELVGWNMASRGTATGTVLVVHGNAGCALDRIYLVEPIHDAALLRFQVWRRKRVKMDAVDDGKQNMWRFAGQPTGQRGDFAPTTVKQWSISSGSGRPVRSNVPSIFTVTIVWPSRASPCTATKLSRGRLKDGAAHLETPCRAETSFVYWASAVRIHLQSSPTILGG